MPREQGAPTKQSANRAHETFRNPVHQKLAGFESDTKRKCRGAEGDQRLAAQVSGENPRVLSGCQKKKNGTAHFRRPYRFGLSLYHIV